MPKNVGIALHPQLVHHIIKLAFPNQSDGAILRTLPVSQDVLSLLRKGKSKRSQDGIYRMNPGSADKMLQVLNAQLVKLSKPSLTLEHLRTDYQGKFPHGLSIETIKDFEDRIELETRPEGRLLDFQSCTDDILKQIRADHQKKVFEITFIGHNLTSAYKEIISMIEGMGQDQSIEFKILYIHPDITNNDESYFYLPSEITDTVNDVTKVLTELLPAALKRINDRLFDRGSKASIKAKPYFGFPYVTGWSIRKPESVKACYVCLPGYRKQAEGFHWPDRSMVIYGEPGRDKSWGGYIADSYYGLFAHLWDDRRNRNANMRPITCGFERLKKSG